MELDLILEQIGEVFRAALGRNLVGVYIHGSIAFGCFNRQSSDIDVIAVARKPLELETKVKIVEGLLGLSAFAPKKGIEMSVVLREYCENFVHPTPYELHFSADHLAQIAQNPREYAEKSCGLDRDLAAHFTVINRVAITLCGEEADTVFAAVPEEYYLDSIKYDIENAREDILQNPVYVILNLCRALAFRREKLVLSKQSGGEWGLLNVPQFAEIIGGALEGYKKSGQMHIDLPAARDFAEYMLNGIFTPGE